MKIFSEKPLFSVKLGAFERGFYKTSYKKFPPASSVLCDKSRLIVKLLITLSLFIGFSAKPSLAKNYDEMLEEFNSSKLTDNVVSSEESKTLETTPDIVDDNFIKRKKELEAMSARWDSLISKVGRNDLFNFESEKSIKVRELAKDDGKIKKFLSESINLSSLIAAAYERNPALADAKIVWKSAIEKYSQAARLDEIMRQYRAFVKDLNTKVGPRLEKASVMMNFPFPGILTIKGDIVSKEVEIAKEKYDIVLRNLIHNLKSSYYECAYLARLVKVIEGNITLLKSLESTAYVKYNTATAPYSDIIKVQLRISRLSDDLTTAKEHKMTVVAKINQLLSLPPMTPLGTLEEEKPNVVNLSVAKLIKMGFSSQQELKIIKLRIQKTNLAITLAEKKFYPDLTAGYSYFENDTGNLAGTNKDRPSFSLRPASKPAFWFGTNDAYIREARLKYQAMQKKRISIEDRLSYRVKELHYLLDKAKRGVYLYKDSLIALSRDALKVSETEYLAAKVDFLNVLDAQEILLDYEIDYARSIKAQRQTAAAMEKTLGTSLAQVK